MSGGQVLKRSGGRRLGGRGGGGVGGCQGVPKQRLDSVPAVSCHGSVGWRLGGSALSCEGDYLGGLHVDQSRVENPVSSNLGIGRAAIVEPADKGALRVLILLQNHEFSSRRLDFRLQIICDEYGTVQAGHHDAETEFLLPIATLAAKFKPQHVVVVEDDLIPEPPDLGERDVEEQERGGGRDDDQLVRGLGELQETLTESRAGLVWNGDMVVVTCGRRGEETK